MNENERVIFTIFPSFKKFCLNFKHFSPFEAQYNRLLTNVEQILPIFN